MLIKAVIWLRQFAEKIERKHHVSEEEVDEVLAGQPPVRRMRRAREREKIFIERWDKPMPDVTCRSFSFIKGKDEHSSFPLGMQTPRS